MRSARPWVPSPTRAWTRASVMSKYRHCEFGQANPSVGIRLGAPRRLFTSHQGRTGAGPAAGEAGEARRQAGQSCGQRGDAADGGACCPACQLLWTQQDRDEACTDAKATPERPGGRTRARTRTYERPYKSSRLEMRNKESFLIIRKVGRDCQADRREDGIIHHRQWLYPRVVLPLDVVDNSTSPLRTHFRLGFSSADAPERVLHPLRQRSCPSCPLPQTASCSYRRSRLALFMLP